MRSGTQVGTRRRRLRSALEPQSMPDQSVPNSVGAAPSQQRRVPADRLARSRRSGRRSRRRAGRRQPTGETYRFHQGGSVKLNGTLLWRSQTACVPNSGEGLILRVTTRAAGTTAPAATNTWCADCRCAPVVNVSSINRARVPRSLDLTRPLDTCRSAHSPKCLILSGIW